MRAKRRCMHGKKMRRSPLSFVDGEKDYTKTNYDFSKSDPNLIGSKIASAVTPKSMIDLMPTSKVIKGLKAGYKLLKS